jgi:hypothetical protein
MIYKFQAEQIQDTLRMVANLLKSQDKKTSLDRDIMQSKLMIENCLLGKPGQSTPRF